MVEFVQRMNQLKAHHHQQQTWSRLASTDQPLAGRAQQEPYANNYGAAAGARAPDLSTPPPPPPQPMMTTTSTLQPALRVSLSSSPSPSAGALAAGSASSLSSSSSDRRPLAAGSAGSSKARAEHEMRSRKAQLRERYEYRMHHAAGREVFAVTMNNNKPGQIMRSGVLSVLPVESGPRRIEPGTVVDPTAAGGRALHLLEYHGDVSARFRPHERQVKPHYVEGYAGQSSVKLSYWEKCHASKKGHSPDSHQRIYKRSQDGNGAAFPWHSPEAQLVRNQQLKQVPEPKRDHVYDIITPHRHDEFEALFDPSLKPPEEDYWKLTRPRGKKCDHISHINHVNPPNTASRVFNL